MAKRCVGCMKLKNSSPVCEHCGYNEHVPNEDHQLPIGTILQGRYQVGKVLGQGGFGITYIGWDTALETPVAIKEYYPGSLVHRESTQNLTVSCTGSNVAELYAQNRERFLREARILAKLQNVPGIVRVQNLFADNNTAYIIMEYVDGINLKQYIRMQNRVLTVSETLAVMQPVIRALNKVHQAELVHRDISPDNIMIQKDGSVVLLDFGAARQVEHADVNHDLTRSTQTILKHGFAPIEQYRSRGNLGPWTDVYALCATMYYCLTGKVPSEAPERVMGDDNVNWKQIPDLTEPQIAVLEQGMAMLPEKRVGSVKELYEALFGQRPVTEVSAQPKKAEPEVVSAPPAEKPAVLVGKSITDYPAYTVDLEETTPAPRTKEHFATTPMVNASKQEPMNKNNEWDDEEDFDGTIKIPEWLTKKVIIACVAFLCAVICTIVLFIKPRYGWVEKNGNHYYYVDGKYLTGLQVVDNLIYYFDADGVMQTNQGFRTIGGKRFYFGSDGIAKTGWLTIYNNKYYFGTNGIMVTGWQEINGLTYYFRTTGIMVTGEQTIGEKKYVFDSNGILRSSHYLESNNSPPLLEGDESTDEQNVFLHIEENNNTPSLQLKQSDISIHVNFTYQLELLNGLKPSDVEWSSEHDHIASVTNSGVVKGIKNGVTKITVTYGNQTDSVIIRVSD